jgi:hypothetical protein
MFFKKIYIKTNFVFVASLIIYDFINLNPIPWLKFLQQVLHVSMGVFGFTFLMEGSKRFICDLDA